MSGETHPGLLAWFKPGSFLPLCPPAYIFNRTVTLKEDPGKCELQVLWTYLILLEARGTQTPCQ